MSRARSDPSFGNVTTARIGVWTLGIAFVLFKLNIYAKSQSVSFFVLKLRMDEID
jgi:hypothetical protein